MIRISVAPLLSSYSAAAHAPRRSSVSVPRMCFPYLEVMSHFQRGIPTTRCTERGFAGSVGAGHAPIMLRIDSSLDVIVAASVSLVVRRLVAFRFHRSTGFYNPHNSYTWTRDLRLHLLCMGRCGPALLDFCRSFGIRPPPNHALLPTQALRFSRSGLRWSCPYSSAWQSLVVLLHREDAFSFAWSALA